MECFGDSIRVFTMLFFNCYNPLGNLNNIKNNNNDNNNNKKHLQAIITHIKPTTTTKKNTFRIIEIKNTSLKHIKHYIENINGMHYNAPTNVLYNFNFITQ